MKRDDALFILGLYYTHSDPSKDDINKAYKKLALKYHPDRKGGDAVMFRELHDAYSYLVNEGNTESTITASQLFRALFSSRPGPGKVANVFIQKIYELQRNHFMSMEEGSANISAMNKNAEKAEINWVISALDTAHLLSGGQAHININAVVNNHHVAEIKTVLQLMKKNHVILTQDNFSAVVNHRNPVCLIEALQMLATAGLMTATMAQGYFNTVVNVEESSLAAQTEINKFINETKQRDLKSTLQAQKTDDPLDPKLTENAAKEMFFNQYNKLANTGGVLGGLFKSRLKPNEPFSDLVLKAMMGRDDRAKTVMVGLGWMEKEGGLSHRTPDCVRNAYIEGYEKNSRSGPQGR